MTDITPAQCRAARSLLNWSQSDLRKATSVARKTISDFENGARVPREANLAVIKNTFEMAGVIFLTEDETLTDGTGLKLKK